jgi:TPR repeat protein
LIKKILISAALFLLSASTALAGLTTQQQAARNKGIILFKQSAWDSAQPPLKIAAEAGDSKAQYYLGEALRLNAMYTTDEARKWYTAAAEQGDLYAMLRLSNSDDLCRIMSTCDGNSSGKWLKQAETIAAQRAKAGDTEAMRVLYTIGKGLHWLEKAAESGDGNAQYFLAIVYENGDGWFFIPGSRERAVEKWARASAVGGYAPGVYFYADILYKKNNGPNNDVAYWLKKAAEMGHLEVVVSYALNVAHLPDTYGYPLNLVEAYGLIYLVSQLTGGGAAPEDARRNLPNISAKMTLEEIQQGIAFSKEWEKTHPPLSYYPPVYGY